MIRLINKAERTLGLPGVRFPSVILEKNGGEAEISDAHFEELKSNRVVSQWLANGIVLTQKVAELRPKGMSVTVLEPKSEHADDSPVEKQVEAPAAGQSDDGFRPAQVKVVSSAGGWYHVYVNDHQVTDKAVRKAEAQKIAAEYD